MKMSWKRIFIYCIPIVVLLIPVNVYVDSHCVVRVYDENGALIPGVTIERFAEFEMFNIRYTEKLQTDKYGKAWFWHINKMVPLGWYMLWSSWYRLNDPCPCCLPESFVSIDEESIPKVGDKINIIRKLYTMNGVNYIVYRFSESSVPSVNWADINEDELRSEIGKLSKMGPNCMLTSDYPNQLSKFHPLYVTTLLPGLMVKYSDGSGYLMKSTAQNVMPNDRTPFDFVSKIQPK